MPCRPGSGQFLCGPGSGQSRLASARSRPSLARSDNSKKRLDRKDDGSLGTPGGPYRSTMFRLSAVGADNSKKH